MILRAVFKWLMAFGVSPSGCISVALCRAAPTTRR